MELIFIPSFFEKALQFNGITLRGFHDALKVPGDPDDFLGLSGMDLKYVLDLNAHISSVTHEMPYMLEETVQLENLIRKNLPVRSEYGTCKDTKSSELTLTRHDNIVYITVDDKFSGATLKLGQGLDSFLIAIVDGLFGLVNEQDVLDMDIYSKMLRIS